MITTENTMFISFNEVVNMVKENIYNRYIKNHSDESFNCHINSSDLQLVKINNDNNVVFFHLPTKAKIRVKVVYPFDIPVEIVEIMPEGKRKYTKISDYNLLCNTPSIYKNCYEDKKKNEIFNISLF